MKHTLLAVATALVVSACDSSSSPPPPPPPPPPSPPAAFSGPVPLTAARWAIRYSPGMPTSPTQMGAGWQFAFPADTGACPAPDTTGPDFDVSPCHHVDYVTYALNASIAEAKSLTITYEVSLPAGVKILAHTQIENTCSPWAGNFHFFVEQRGDAALNTDGWRWWAAPQVLANTTTSVTVTVPLNEGKVWSGVFGEIADPTANRTAWAQYQATLAGLGNIGLTFGGGCFAGHGAYAVGGAASFTLTEFTINK